MADSIIVILIVSGIIFFGFMTNMLPGALNPAIAQFNDQVSKNLVSEDTQYWFDLNKIIYQSTPVLLLIGLLIFIYERGVGTNISVKLFYSYGAMLMIGTTLSMYLVLFLGGLEDQFLNTLWTNPQFAHPYSWDCTDSIMLIMPVLYIACSIPSLLTAGLSCFWPILKQRDNALVSGNYGDDDYVTNYAPSGNIEQFRR